jgi:hypothetical protein
MRGEDATGVNKAGICALCGIHICHNARTVSTEYFQYLLYMKKYFIFKAMSHIFLRIVEDTGVALYRDGEDGTAEIVPTRQGLYRYSDGYALGYSGSGPQNLSHAIVGKVFELDHHFRWRIIVEGRSAVGSSRFASGSG